jgi:nitroreductase
MTEHHRPNRWPPTADLFLETRRVPDDAELPAAEEENVTAPRPDPSNCLNWSMLALWLFVAICFAALAFFLYVIWAKCGGT